MGAGVKSRARKRAEYEARILQAMQDWSARVMQWGLDDCMLAVADIIRDVDGRDPARRFRGRYTSRRGALRAMGVGGTARAAAQSASAMHWRPINPLQALPGDVGLAQVLILGPRGPERVLAGMVCRAPGWFVGRNDRGFTLKPASLVERAWAVA